MSKGPGKVQRAIAVAFTTDDAAFLTVELCEIVYPGVPIEKRHRIALARAAKGMPGIESLECKRLGGERVYFDPTRVMSYAIARLKADTDSDYRNNDPRVAAWRATTEAD